MLIRPLLRPEVVYEKVVKVVLLGELYQSFFHFSFNEKMFGIWPITMAKDEQERVFLSFQHTLH